MEVTDEELFFALFCLFDDLDKLRSSLMELWRQYKARRVDLMTVSVTTNTAINLVRRTEENLLAIFPMLESYDEILRKFYCLLCAIRRVDPDTATSDVMLDVADWLYMPARQVLNSFFDIIQEDHAPSIDAIARCSL